MIHCVAPPAELLYRGLKRTRDEVLAAPPALEASWDLENEVGSEEELIEPDFEPPAKKSKSLGRPPIPDEPCEHGPSLRNCAKCAYKQRVERHVVTQQHRSALMKILFVWSQNLVYFGSLAQSLVLPFRDPGGNERVCQIVDHRIEQFQVFQEVELEEVEQNLPNCDNTVKAVLDTLTQAAPLTFQSLFMANWLVTRTFPDGLDLKTLIGDPCFQMTTQIAALFNPACLCPGVTEPSEIEHFEIWKGIVWCNKDGVQAVHQNGDPCVRSSSCSGFSDALSPSTAQKSPCSKCSAVRRHLQKEKSAYKVDPPGLKFLQTSLSPGLRKVLETWKKSAERQYGWKTPGSATTSPNSSTPQTPVSRQSRSIASSSASLPPDF